MFSKKTKKILCRIILERTGEPAVFDEEKCDVVLKREAIDWLFVGLSFFTHIYLAVLALTFFAKLADVVPGIFSFLEIFQNPYLGALGIYVVLKEVRKRSRIYPSRYWGETFVIAWLALMAVATALVLFSAEYVFDGVYKIIFTNGLVVLLIYIGGIINKP